MERFITFLGSLRTEGNSSILESIAHGYMACFENIEPPRLKLRVADKQEKEDYRAKKPHLPLEASHGLIVITDPEDNILAYAQSPRDAEAIRNNLESKAKKMLNLTIPVAPPPNILPGDNMADPELEEQKKASFWLWKENWEHYINETRRILGDREKFEKSQPWAFKKYEDAD